MQHAPPSKLLSASEFCTPFRMKVVSCKRPTVLCRLQTFGKISVYPHPGGGKAASTEPSLGFFLCALSALGGRRQKVSLNLWTAISPVSGIRWWHTAILGSHLTSDRSHRRTSLNMSSAISPGCNIGSMDDFNCRTESGYGCPDHTCSTSRHDHQTVNADASACDSIRGDKNE
jgi:hypothetical protein